MLAVEEGHAMTQTKSHARAAENRAHPEEESARPPSAAKVWTEPRRGLGRYVLLFVVVLVAATVGWAFFDLAGAVTAAAVAAIFIGLTVANQKRLAAEYPTCEHCAGTGFMPAPKESIETQSGPCPYCSTVAPPQP